MSCDDLKESYELYALGVAEPDERAEIEAHLSRGCAECAAGVREARRLAASLAAAAPDVLPPARLRQRVVNAVGPAAESASAPQRAGSSFGLAHAWAMLAFLMLGAVLWYAYNERRLTAQIAGLSRRITASQAEYAMLETQNRKLVDALALINLPDSRQLVFGRPDREPPRGRVWVHPERGVLLLASRLPPAPAGRIYEMWIVPKGAPPIPAGLFLSNPRGEATHVWPGPVSIAAAAAVAVTLEPESGSLAPTSTPLIAANF